MDRRALFCGSLILLTSAACSKPGGTDGPTRTTDASPLDAGAVAVDAGSASSVDDDAGASAPAPKTPKKFARVLQTGDSMVGGGLSRALRPMFEAAGMKYYRDVIESGTIYEFSQNDHLPKLLAKVKPDLVLVTLGANHIPNSVDPDKELGPFIPKLLKRLEGIDCYWIAPPIWKPSQAKFNAWLGEHVAPCKFYDGSNLTIARRPDKIHPNEKGGEVWAKDFFRYFEGEGAFYETPVFETPGAPTPSLLSGAATPHLH